MHQNPCSHVQIKFYLAIWDISIWHNAYTYMHALPWWHTYMATWHENIHILWYILFMVILILSSILFTLLKLVSYVMPSFHTNISLSHDLLMLSSYCHVISCNNVILWKCKKYYASCFLIIISLISNFILAYHSIQSYRYIYRDNDFILFIMISIHLFQSMLFNQCQHLSHAWPA